MSPIDYWYLHRERLLVGVGVLLGVISVLVALEGASGATGYDAGKTAGVATRGVVFGTIIASAGHWLVERLYWRDSTARLRLPSECVALAGMIAVAISLAFGPSGPRASPDVRASAGCDDPSPINSMPKGSYEEVTDAQAARIAPELSAAPAEGQTNIMSYVVGTPRDPALMTIGHIGGEPVADPKYFGDFQATRRAAGEVTSEFKVAGIRAIRSTPAGTKRSAIFMPLGCHLMTVAGSDAKSTLAHTKVIVTGG